ncbi:MAG: tripartite tricarboxylate transporter permease [Oscillospiraceae bacterium]|nr:tripartite tricarboxylate transporter permease [Oscillospiraceae bacterium]
MGMLSGLTAVLSEPVLIVLVALGTLAGVYVGAVPGLSGTMAVSLLVSFTLGWETRSALAVMIGVYVGAVFGGSRPAILLNVPGAPAAVATSLDGYELAKKGRAGEAMGAATVQSSIGTFFGVLALLLFAPPVSELARSFRSVDYLLLALIGLLAVGSLSGRSLTAGVIAGCAGIFLGCVGVDAQTAVRRFTFDVVYLNSGVDRVVAMIGLFGASEALFQLADAKAAPVRQKIDRVLPPLGDALRFLPLTLRSAVIGILVGALPGAGGDVAALLSYDHAKRTTAHPAVPFGEGALEGVIAPETANNAAIGGAFIPMLTLGIPGDAVTAVLLSAFTVKGLRPGPNLIRESPEFFGFIVVCLLLAAIFLPLFGLTGVRAFVKLTEIPREVLMPSILVLSAVGAYAIRNSLADVLWMFLFGVAGYFLKRFGYPVAPAVVGLILTRLCEENYRRGVMLAGSVPAMLASVFKSPVSVILLALLVFLLAAQARTRLRAKRKDMRHAAGQLDGDEH